MAEPELVNKIVRKVVRALDGAVPAANMARSTGSPVSSAVKPKPLGRVFLTADALKRRIPLTSGAIELAYNEFLTPAAQDLVDEKHLTVRQAPKPALRAQGSGNEPQPQQVASVPAGCASIGMITDRSDAQVESVIASLGYDGLEAVDYNLSDCWMQNLRTLCGAVASGEIAAGIAIMKYAADAMLLAGKIKGIRPVQATRLESVSAAIRHFGANLLIVEYAFSTFHEMRAMVRLFAADRSAAGAAGSLLSEVRDLERL